MPLRRPLWGNAALAILAPALFLLLLEALLAAAGVRPLALTEDPLVGFSSRQPLFVEDAATGSAILKTNPAKLTHFNAQSFPREKPDGAFRIFAVGGSTTYGHPWRDPVSYSGWLRALLPAADPSRPWEVINAGGISYASYREAALVEEITRYRPDLILVYSGHNEFLEERTYRSTTEIPAALRDASALLDRTRTYTVMRRALRKLRGRGSAGRSDAGKPQLAEEVDDVLARTVGPQTYVRDDSLRQRVLEHYRLSLRRMAALAEASGAKVLFLTTPGNERDCSPFKSERTPGLSPESAARADALQRRADSLESAGARAEAGAALDSAVALDPRNAALLYRSGKAALAAGRHAEAKRLLVRALDEDVCPLRALPAMRDIVLETARETGSEALDVGAALEQRTRARLGHDILGEPEFVDHVHLAIDEYRRIALAVMDRLASRGVLRYRPGWDSAAVQAVADKVMAGMGPRELGEGLHNIAKVLNWAGKHEDAARIAAQGLAVDSTGLEAIWSSLFVGAALEREGRSAEAVPHYRRAVNLDPGNEMSRGFLRDAMVRAGMDPASASGASPGAAPGAAAGPPPQAGVSDGNRAGQGPAAQAALLLGEGKVPEALAFLEGQNASMAKDPSLAYFLGEALRRSGKAVEAEAAYRRALSLDPGTGRAFLGLARLAELRGDVPEAINLYSQALAASPDLSEARSALSRVLEGMPITP
jgi:tetratricopeptide (TPR) repeat protein